MKVTYIYHSGFLVETEKCYYLFDYYRGTIPELDTEKPILVFCSHAHADHYNKKVFTLLEEMGMRHVTAVLAKDISKQNYPSGNVECVRVRHDEHYELPGETRLYTLLSTDAGVAFAVECPEGTVYHAGDLNDWVWKGEPGGENRQMTGSYRHEIQKLKEIPLDVAFLPLDPRQEELYAEGILYFLRTVSVKEIFPMHYWDKPEIIDKFLAEYPMYRDKIRFTETVRVSAADEK